MFVGVFITDNYWTWRLVMWVDLDQYFRQLYKHVVLSAHVLHSAFKNTVSVFKRAEWQLQWLTEFGLQIWRAKLTKSWHYLLPPAIILKFPKKRMKFYWNSHKLCFWLLKEPNLSQKDQKCKKRSPYRYKALYNFLIKRLNSSNLLVITYYQAV